MPVLPDVPSMIVPPGLSLPERSASSIIFTAIRSLIELPGLNVSILANTSASTRPRGIRFSRTSGVLPITSRMFWATFLRVAMLCARHLFELRLQRLQLTQQIVEALHGVSADFLIRLAYHALHVLQLREQHRLRIDAALIDDLRQQPQQWMRRLELRRSG